MRNHGRISRLPVASVSVSSVLANAQLNSLHQKSEHKFVFRYQLCLVCQSWRQMITESPGVVDKLLFRIPFHTSQLRLLEPESRTRLDTLIIASENVAAIPTVYCLQKEANAYTALGMAKFLEVHNLGVHLSNQEWWKDLWMFPALRSLACSITKHFPVQIPADSLRVLANIKVRFNSSHSCSLTLLVSPQCLCHMNNIVALSLHRETMLIIQLSVDLKADWNFRKETHKIRNNHNC